MPVYQVPQFLDSGDKILGPLNVRQFGYALGGFLIAFLVYTITAAIVPGLGILALIPAAPIAALAAYLAMGKYNGRDSEVYVFKYIIFLKKPRVLKFKRLPNTSDLYMRLKELSTEGITNEWNRRLQQKIRMEQGSFDTKSAEEKIKRIKSLGSSIDNTQLMNLNNLQTSDVINKIKQKNLTTQYSTNKMEHNIISKRQMQNQPPQ